MVETISKLNPDVKEDLVFERLEQVVRYHQEQIGLIELAADLEIETVTEIFIRINSKGVWCSARRTS